MKLLGKTDMIKGAIGELCVCVYLGWGVEPLKYRLLFGYRIIIFSFATFARLLRSCLNCFTLHKLSMAVVYVFGMCLFACPFFNNIALLWSILRFCSKNHENTANHATHTIVMMTSSNGSLFRVTGHLCGEFNGHERNTQHVWFFNQVWNDNDNGFVSLT